MVCFKGCLEKVSNIVRVGIGLDDGLVKMLSPTFINSNHTPFKIN